MTAGNARNCGACTLCCKVLGIAALKKPAGRWCSHCQPGRGCAAYEARPAECRTFHCLWLTQTFLGPEWKPDRAKFVLYLEHDGARLMVQADPGAPTSWRSEPYYSQLKAWAVAAAKEQRQVVVRVNDQATVILPDRDVPLGSVRDGERIVTRQRLVGGRPVLDVEKVAAS